MTLFETVSLALVGVISLVVPLIIFLIRGAIKWTRVEDKLTQAISRLDDLVRDKETTHAAMLQQMSDDRKATDLRLRWLEQNVWRYLPQTPGRENNG